MTRRPQHVINISGGKDSGACLDLAIMRGVSFRAVIADTGNESKVTWDHIDRVSDHIRAQTGGVGVEVVRADFTDRIARKRHTVETKWRNDGVPESIIQQAIAALQPTGNPFLDLCIWKGRFPSRKAQFCTEFLKQEAIWQQVLEPTLLERPVIQWIGVRRDESLARRHAPRLRKVRQPNGLHTLVYFSPIVHWTGHNAVNFTREMGGPINPLYRQGFSRVGCFPCINAKKDEVAKIGSAYPEAIDRIMQWERIVSEASKRGRSSFFAGPTTPEGAAMCKAERAAKAKGQKPPNVTYPNAGEVVEWARTARGGKQFDMLRNDDLDGTMCASAYGLCE